MPQPGRRAAGATTSGTGTPQTRQRDALIVSILAYAGLRPGELRALPWEDCARTRSSFSTRPTPTARASRRRTASVAPSACSALAQDIREHRLAMGRPPEATLILLDDDGRPWDKNAWQIWRADRWAPACQAVGLDPVPRPYDLRHSFASLLLAEGKQPIWCAKQLGHTLAVFLSTYAHLVADRRVRRPRADRRGRGDREGTARSRYAFGTHSGEISLHTEPRRPDKIPANPAIPLPGFEPGFPP